MFMGMPDTMLRHMAWAARGARGHTGCHSWNNVRSWAPCWDDVSAHDALSNPWFGACFGEFIGVRVFVAFARHLRLENKVRYTSAVCCIGEAVMLRVEKDEVLGRTYMETGSRRFG